MRSLFAVLFVFTFTAAQWKSLNGPEGGSVLALAGAGDTIVAGTKGGGIFRTINGGTSWSAVNSGVKNFHIEALAASGAMMYAGGYNFDGGFYVSSDFGATWNERTGASALKFVKAIVRTNTSLLAGTYGMGLFRSTDEGTSWTKIDSGLTNTAFSALLNVKGTIYAGSTSGVFVSTDDGISWTKRSTGLTTTQVQAFCANDSMVFAGTTNGIFVTKNAGESWTAKNNGLTFSVSYALGISGGKLLSASNASVCYSNNFGDNWNNAVTQNGMSGYTVTPAMLVTGNTVYAATMYDVYRSDNNGINWVKRSSGINAVSSQGLFAGPSVLLSSYGTYGIKRSTDGGQFWRNSDSTLSTQIKSFYAGDRNIHASSATGGLFHTTDLGVKWISDTMPSGVFTVASGWARIGSTMYVSENGKGVFKSTNGGGKWVAASTDISMPKAIWSLLAVDTILYAGTIGGIFRSSTGGNTWVQSSGGNTTLQNAVVTALSWVNGKMYAATMELGVFLSTNNGATWRLFGTPLQTSVNSFATSQQRLFAVSQKDGIVVLKDTVWTPFMTGLPTKQIGSVQFAGDTIYASTLGMGIWKRPFADVLTGVGRTSGSVPEGFSLSQNFPNPFNPATIIRFTVPSAQHITLSVYDMLGRRIAVLTDGIRNAGSYDVPFRADGLASGIYLYRLQTSAGSVTRTMTLIQ